MKDLRVVLRQKEEEMRQLKIHIYCLKIAIPLLLEPGDQPPPAPPLDTPYQTEESRL